MKKKKYFLDESRVREVADVSPHSGGEHMHGESFSFDRRWFDLMSLFIALVMVALLGRVFYLSVLQHDQYAYTASGNVIRETALIAPRGRIFDRDGEMLADNEPNFSVVLRADTSLFLDSDDEGYALYRKKIGESAEFFGLSEDFVLHALSEIRTSGQDLVLLEKISREDGISYRSSSFVLPGIEIEKNASRIYPESSFFSHIVGYEGLIKREDYDSNREKGYLLTDRIGKTGLEYYYEDELRGSHGVKRQVVDNREREVRGFRTEKAIPGRNLYTHIDSDLQRALTLRLQQEFPRAQTKRAAAVALDPRNGAVLALVSLPSYDNNAFVHGIDSDLYSSWISDEDRPLFNRTISGVYPPGSTVKPALGAAVLEEGVVSADYQIESKGGISIGESFFGDWRVHGFTDLRRAIAVSSDVYFYTVSGGHSGVKGLGIERMAKWMKKFGYGSKTQIDLPSEVSGLYPTPEDKKDLVGERWYVGDTYNTSIGQGFVTATPLQVANSIAAIANGGRLYAPRVGAYFEDTSGKREEIPPAILYDEISDPLIVDTIQKGMRDTVTEGTARMMQSVSVPVAGKTGTAQFYGEDEKVHSWFASYAPFENPEIVLLILMEGQTGEISSATVPVAKDVLEWYFDGRDPEMGFLVQEIDE